MNKNDIFEKLADHLCGGEYGGIKTPALFEIFEILFTPEQAEYALQMPLARKGEITAEQLALKLGKPAQEVSDMVETMARGCTVQAVRKGKDQTLYCSVFPLVPGIMETFFGTETDHDKKDRMAKLWREHYPVYLDQTLTRFKFPGMRIVPINQRMTADSQVLTFEEISNIIKSARTLTVMDCHCRAVAKERCNHMLSAEIVLNDWAEYVIQFRGARKWTVDEVLQKLRECREDGLVSLVANTQAAPRVICNCCTCCCDTLRSMVTPERTDRAARTNFIPTMDHDACCLCLSCVEICPAKAIIESSVAAAEQGVGSRIMVQEDLCIGCGLCSTHCPEDAIQMKKVRDVVPPETGSDLMKKMIQG